MKKNKINVIRTIALALVFAGIIVTYGSFLTNSALISGIFMFLGLFMVLLSTVIYFWIGFISSTRAVYVSCPNCEKTTKVLGKIDNCTHCNQKLTLDKKLATDHQ